MHHQRIFPLVAALLITLGGRAQLMHDSIDTATHLPQKERTVSLLLEGQAIATSDVVPFWMLANQFGSIPLSGVSTSYIGRFEKKYSGAKKQFFDWGMAVEGRANVGQESNVTLIEGYVKAKIGMFDLRVGRVKEVIGLMDTSLSSGSFSMSGNALGIPKAEISVPDYFPFFGGKLLAFKGNFAHGQIGDIERNRLAGSGTEYLIVPTYFHQKSLYGRFGKDTWKVRLYGGFNHAAFWGSEKIRYGGGFDLSPVETFWYVVQGRVYNKISSKIGNHLGSIDLGVQLNFKNTKLMLYRQNFYDVGALYYLANIQDGLHGLSFENKRQGTSKLKWKKFLLEFLYTKNQAGEPWSPITKSGAEDYYNSSEYRQGWSYSGQGLGTPFISPKSSVRKGLPVHPHTYFTNNRVMVFHSGLEGLFGDVRYTLKLSYSKNYGTWNTSSFGRRKGGPIEHRDPPVYGIFPEVDQFSSYLEVSKTLRNKLRLGCVFALDRGDLLPNTAGLQLKIAKAF